MNLYLYIPPNSAHPEGILKSLIYGRLRTYWKQNTYAKDFERMQQHLQTKLIDRGYTKEHLQPIFTTALTRIQTEQSQTNNKNNNNQTDTENRPLFFHLDYHPRGIQRQQIRAAFHNTLGTIFPNHQLIVAQHRLPNIRDRICKTKLTNVNNNNPSNYLEEHKYGDTT